MNPRRFSNQTRKSRRTRYGSRGISGRLLPRRARRVQVARGQMALSDRVETRLLVDAQRPRILTTRMEAAAERRGFQRGQEGGGGRRRRLRAFGGRGAPPPVPPCRQASVSF